MENSLAPSARRTYVWAQSLFMRFCITNGWLPYNGTPCPASELTLLSFIGAIQDRQASTAKVYLSAVRSLHIMLGHQDPFINCPRIPLAVRGLLRTQASSAQRSKLPITALILHTLRLQLDLSLYNDVMIWAAFCTAFFGFSRASEFTIPPTGFNEKFHLSPSSMSIDRFPIPNTVFLFLKFSKTDQLGKGCYVILARSDSPLVYPGICMRI